MPLLCENNIFFEIQSTREHLQGVITADAQLVQAGTIGNCESSDELIGHVH